MTVRVSHGGFDGDDMTWAMLVEYLAHAGGWAMVDYKAGGWLVRAPAVRLERWVTAEHLAGEWDDPPLDPLVYLLVHRADAGRVPAASLGPLAARLRALQPQVAPLWASAATGRLAAACEAAAAAGADLRFG